VICYRDRTFCLAPGCTCGRALTPEIEAAAERAGLPLCLGKLCDGAPTSSGGAG